MDSKHIYTHSPAPEQIRVASKFKR